MISLSKFVAVEREALYCPDFPSEFDVKAGDWSLKMTKADEQQIRAIVQEELLGIITDAQESMGMKKDPTGMGRRALEGLADLIRDRQSTQTEE
jgi:hypothetical protein